jgi:hypothetical protein
MKWLVERFRLDLEWKGGLPQLVAARMRGIVVLIVIVVLGVVDCIVGRLKMSLTMRWFGAPFSRGGKSLFWPSIPLEWRKNCVVATKSESFLLGGHSLDHQKSVWSSLIEKTRHLNYRRHRKPVVPTSQRTIMSTPSGSGNRHQVTTALIRARVQ